MLQTIWEHAVTLIVGDIIIPAVQHPVPTVCALGIMLTLAIWRA